MRKDGKTKKEITFGEFGPKKVKAVHQNTHNNIQENKIYLQLYFRTSKYRWEKEVFQGMRLSDLSYAPSSIQKFYVHWTFHSQQRFQSSALDRLFAFWLMCYLCVDFSRDTVVMVEVEVITNDLKQVRWYWKENMILKWI